MQSPNAAHQLHETEKGTMSVRRSVGISALHVKCISLLPTCSLKARPNAKKIRWKKKSYHIDTDGTFSPLVHEHHSSIALGLDSLEPTIFATSCDRKATPYH